MDFLWFWFEILGRRRRETYEDGQRRLSDQLSYKCQAQMTIMMLYDVVATVRWEDLRGSSILW